MRQIQTDLWETAPYDPMPGLTTHAYLFAADEGNVLFYNTGHAGEIDAMAELGGVQLHYLSHQDELGDTIRTIRERFRARLGGHIRERESFARYCLPDILFDEREWHGGRIEVIPTPGHSPGSTCFRVRSATGKTYLFTGDTLFLDREGRWRAGYISGYSEREPLAESLRLLRGLAPDLVVSSAAPSGVGFQELTPESWPELVNQALQRLPA